MNVYVFFSFLISKAKFTSALARRRRQILAYDRPESTQ